MTIDTAFIHLDCSQMNGTDRCKHSRMQKVRCSSWQAGTLNMIWVAKSKMMLMLSSNAIDPGREN